MPLATDLVFIDVNVPMYAAGGPHPLRGPCREVLAAIIRDDLPAVTDTEVHQEIFYRFLALRKPSLAIQLSSHLLDVIPDVLAIRRQEILLLPDLALTYPGLQARDLIHVAVMQGYGISRIVSADTGFDRVAGVVRIPPERFPAEA